MGKKIKKTVNEPSMAINSYLATIAYQENEIERNVEKLKEDLAYEDMRRNM